ncbi:hypothetical protein OSTOST_09190 [Ostertagia ostertagi]
MSCSLVQIYRGAFVMPMNRQGNKEGISEPQQSGRSPFAVLFQSPFAQRRGTSLQNLSPTLARKLAPRLCRGFSDPVIRRKTSSSSMFTSLSPDRHESGTIDFLTLPPIPETTAPSSSSSDYKDDGD